MTNELKQQAVQDANLTLGRGAWWLLVDAEVGGTVAGRVGWFAGGFAGVAVSGTSDGFRWGRGSAAQDRGEGEPVGGFTARG